MTPSLFGESTPEPASNGRADKAQNLTRGPLPAVRRNAPATSLRAALSMIPHTPAQRARVFAFIESCGPHGATDHEIGAALGLTASSVCPRRGELAREKRIVLTGGTRATPSGRRARVWVEACFAPAGTATPEVARDA